MRRPERGREGRSARYDLALDKLQRPEGAVLEDNLGTLLISTPPSVS
jgi:hypothetical protein